MDMTVIFIKIIFQNLIKINGSVDLNETRVRCVEQTCFVLKYDSFLFFLYAGKCFPVFNVKNGVLFIIQSESWLECCK
jgi:hypothetical protein